MDDEHFFQAIERLIAAGSAYVHHDTRPPTQRQLEVLAARVEQEIKQRRQEQFQAAMFEEDRRSRERYASWRRSVGV